jgi:tRNA (guanosine-2'-O-)-methyltransferase
MKSSLRIKADKAKQFRCKDLIVVLENPKNLENVGSVIRNIDALGAEKLYVVDGNNLLPDDWNQMRNRTSLNKISASAIKWTFVKKFNTAEDCLKHLQNKKFDSIVTSPHVKGKTNWELSEGKYTNKRLAVWFGNESQGVSEKAIENSLACVSIPMNGIIESLNLGTSTGIVLYVITNQRRNYVPTNPN